MKIKKKTKNIILSFFLIMSVALTFLPAVSKTQIISEAGFDYCSEIGEGMGAKSPVNTDVIANNAGSRKWTAQELFSDSMRFTQYFGEGDGDWMLAKTGDRTKGYPFMGDSDVQEKVKGIRSVDRCIGRALSTTPGNLFLSLANALSNFTSWIVATLFSGNIICTDFNSSGSSGCINLIGIIGGRNGNGGIIGSLRDSIFIPLVTLVFLFVAVWLIYKGLVKREFRASLMGVLWSLFAFIMGGIALWNPTLLASVPQQFNSAISTCILGAMNGQNCITGTVSAPSTLVGEECVSKAATRGNEGAALAANGMTCSIWKSFVLDAWSRGQFGYGYNDLYISNAPSNGSLIETLPNSTSQYGVSLNSSTSAKNLKGKTLQTNGSKIYNLALYQLYLGANVKTNGDNKFTTNVNDKRWFNIVGIAAKDPTMWNRWAPRGASGFQRFGNALMSVIVILIVGVSLAIFSFWGLAYMFAGTLLMAFAPLFLLVAIEPGRGRKIFLGWLESVISSILKYMASALFVIIALTLYSSIISATDSFYTSFIGIFIMAGTLFLYRKEIINMMGMASLGGQRFSNAVGDKIQKDAKGAKENLAAVGGGALGGLMAARHLDKDSRTAGFRTKSMIKGAVDAGGRQAKRGQNFTGGLARQYSASKRYADKENKVNKRQREKESLDETSVMLDRAKRSLAEEEKENNSQENKNPTNSTKKQNRVKNPANKEPKKEVTKEPIKNSPAEKKDEINPKLPKIEETEDTENSYEHSRKEEISQQKLNPRKTPKKEIKPKEEEAQKNKEEQPPIPKNPLGTEKLDKQKEVKKNPHKRKMSDSFNKLQELKRKNPRPETKPGEKIIQVDEEITITEETENNND